MSLTSELLRGEDLVKTVLVSVSGTKHMMRLSVPVGSFRNLSFVNIRNAAKST